LTSKWSFTNSKLTFVGLSENFLFQILNFMDSIISNKIIDFSNLVYINMLRQKKQVSTFC
jgi:hypothetical protein